MHSHVESVGRQENVVRVHEPAPRHAPRKPGQGDGVVEPVERPRRRFAPNGRHQRLDLSRGPNRSCRDTNRGRTGKKCGTIGHKRRGARESGGHGRFGRRRRKGGKARHGRRERVRLRKRGRRSWKRAPVCQHAESWVTREAAAPSSRRAAARVQGLHVLDRGRHIFGRRHPARHRVVEHHRHRRAGAWVAHHVGAFGEPWPVVVVLRPDGHARGLRGAVCFQRCGGGKLTSKRRCC
mmetsp:Transcript_69315/g.119103  ORF Transcript_69315/g.119103 Transcript_69315/m.119103 type:complete len:237 (+) Transcript_69315:599-1309(+)